MELYDVRNEWSLELHGNISNNTPMYKTIDTDHQTVDLWVYIDTPDNLRSDPIYSKNNIRKVRLTFFHPFTFLWNKYFCILEWIQS